MTDFTEEELKIPPIKYEYLDHPADVQLHAYLENQEEPLNLKMTWKSQGRMVDFEKVREIQCSHGDLKLILLQGGDDLTEAFEQCATAMFGYMTEIDYVEMTNTVEIEAEGDDMLSLLFRYLDEFLFVFCADDFFIPRKVKILEFDKENFKIKARGYGETFTLGKHPQGTEVKAITYSNMQVHDNEGQHEVFVIIDI